MHTESSIRQQISGDGLGVAFPPQIWVQPKVERRYDDEQKKTST